MEFDLPIAELETYRPEPDEADDFDAFWERTLAEARAHPLDPRFELVDAGLETVDVYDVTYSGYEGQRIKAWLRVPRGAPRPRPAIVEFIGYGGGRGLAHDRLLWSAAGYAHFVMDVRGQGSVSSPGDTPDPESPGGGANPQAPGFMTRGILDPNAYYYRRLFTDAVRAIESVRAHDAVDPSRVVVTGGSQGGGTAIAAAALVPDVAAAMPDVPFLCHFRRAVEITDRDPYAEIRRYLAIHRGQDAQVFRTLSYFDGVSFARRARVPALFSVGLMDWVCPPSTVFAAYNHWAGAKQIRVWPYNDHEGGAEYQQREQLAYVREVVKR